METLQVFTNNTLKKDKRTEENDYESLAGFIFTTIWITICAGICFKRNNGFILTIGFLHKTYMVRESLVAYIVIFAVGLFSYLYIFKGKKNYLTEFFVALFPIGIFMILKLGVKYLPLIILEVTILIYLLVEDWQEIKHKQRLRLISKKSTKLNYKKIVLKLLKKSKYRIGIALYSYVSLFIICTIVLGFYSNKKEYSTNVQVTEYPLGTNLFEENKDELYKLQDENYKKFTFEEKLNALQVIVNIECSYLGLRPVQLTSQCLCERELAGYYDKSLRMIVIDKEIVEGMYEMEYTVSVILHEIYHVYENQCVEAVDFSKLSETDANLKFFRDVKIWKEEIDNYNEFKGYDAGYESFLAYSNQKLETCADEYSDQWTDSYIRYINNIDMPNE